MIYNKESGLENIAKMAEDMKDMDYRSAWRTSNGVDLAAAETIIGLTRKRPMQKLLSALARGPL